MSDILTLYCVDIRTDLFLFSFLTSLESDFCEVERMMEDTEQMKMPSSIPAGAAPSQKFHQVDAGCPWVFL